ncbi:bifunctional phosphopantothenoylcysteine decarboxylase/phosphopantothenate--cysteine ligase CoaBC [Parafilimonas terrae]|jgi:phosphopantothenoylcysteine decarboxylase/phosphopantothenate--cysteine ligase|uniref:Coenzyme A biosynthesis bifunctional protein CoaBC n=1 Tax=Parafilimonas terrae TaxID=1465490 RepID=A0A1I5SMK4_9BACT|nr:bifunctional phosphopantothenoylcysteine decarboxylase/phosphopantothenate--cysteine ligase CoaBC [Parafilimonas terrae]SFP71983.1 phosphopantothenoylcysteine decarboxylase / phosphopantothenate--cysteine ligase [Parafilimonas terrae]
MLKGKKILLGISASIAAYKSILLARLLVKEGAEVKVIMTPAAKDFVSPLVLSTLTNNKVLIDIFNEDSWANHVMLGRWADAMLIAPLSCNTLAKMAHGQCDNLLLAIYLSSTCPVAVAPAMDEDMWHHPSTQKNIAALKEYGNILIDVESGELASGLIGEGRMAEPENIVFFLKEKFFRQNILKNKKALVTAGPTYEPLDPVRFVGNHSSGKMGFALAEDLYEKGADVTVVSGPVYQQTKYKGIKVINVNTAEEMYNTCLQLHDEMDIEIMAAAVADYKPAAVAPEKIKKTNNSLQLELAKTNDILATLGARKKHQFLVGFALETNNEKQHALDKLEKKNADMIVLNSLKDANAGFGFDTNKVSVFSANGDNVEMELASKKEIANKIVDLVIKKIHA